MGPALLALALLLPTPELHVDGRRGFQVEVPQRWQTFEQETESEGYSLHLLPPGSLGERGVTIVVRELGEGEGLDDVLVRARARAAELGAAVAGEGEAELGGAPAPELDLRLDSPQGELRVRVAYAVRGGLSYGVQRSAKAAEYLAHEETLEAVVDTIAFSAPAEPAGEEGAAASLDALVERLGSRVSWAPSWDDAVRRARTERRPILVVAFLYSGFDLEQTPRTTTFAEDDVVELVEERCVPFELRPGTEAGFPSAYGLSRTAFGQGLFLVAPDGEVLRETHHASAPDLAYAFLREALAELPEHSGTAVPSDAPALERARRHVARGELEAALELLATPRTAQGWRLRAKALRLARRGQDALAALGRARALEGDVPGDALDAAWLQMRLGHPDEARALLEEHGGPGTPSDVRGRALYLTGLLDLATGEPDRARATWREAVDEAQESRWAARCAAALRNDLLATGVRPSFAWPSPAVYEELRAASLTPPARAREDVAREGALAWLLEHQLEDGSWGSFANGDPAPELGPDPFGDSAAALAVRALLRHRSHPGAEEAARRAVDFLRATVQARAETPPQVLYMDYMTWSDAMMLEAFADATEAGLVEAADLRGTVGTLVRDLAARQTGGGGWSYYVTGDLSEESALPPHCMSFTTAAATIALARARRAGFTVPDAVLDPAVDVLAAMRAEDGVFPYFHFEDAEGSARPLGLAGEVGRGPACELALHLGGASHDERLAGALELFLEHAPSYAAERGKVLMHAGPAGQGSHYLFYDYAHAALVAERLPEDPGTRARLVELVLDARQPDGSFLDTPLLGRPYGTAMALLALAALERG